MLKQKRVKGYLKYIVNTKGKKSVIAIVLPVKPRAPKGKPWLARLYNAPYTRLKYGKTAEGLAMVMAKAGHKKVIIMD